MSKRAWMGVLLLTLASASGVVLATDPVNNDTSAVVAQSADEHLAEAARYDAEAEQLQANATKHYRLAKSYAARALGTKSAGAYRSMERHCRRLAKSYEQAAQDARTLAQEHRGMAK